MRSGPLPTSLDVYKAALRGARVCGQVAPGNLARLRGLLATDEGFVEARLECFRDEEQRTLVRIGVEAQLFVTCQRCLEPVSQMVRSESLLALVSSDAEAALLPGTMEPLVVPEQPCNPGDLVEEELLLALQPFAYHDADACRKTLAPYRSVDQGEDVGNGRPNPFNVLAQLKPGEHRQE